MRRSSAWEPLVQPSLRNHRAIWALAFSNCIPTDFRQGLLAQRRCDFLGKFRLNLYHRPIDEHGLRAPPLNSFGIERNHIPERAGVAATGWSRSRQLLIQLFGNKVVLIPELLDPGI